MVISDYVRASTLRANNNSAGRALRTAFTSSNNNSILGNLDASSLRFSSTGQHSLKEALKPYVNQDSTISFDMKHALEDPSENLARPGYLDNNATTPLDPRVLDKMLPYMITLYGNPHSRAHLYGWETEEEVEKARLEVGKLINAKRPAKEIIFTSGATESNNIAIKGAALYLLKQRKDAGNTKPIHIITTQVDHKCVLATCRDLELDYPGEIKVTYLGVKEDGLVDLEELERAIIPDETAIVSVLHVHNEIGVIQPLKEIGQICKKNKIIFHSDIAQGCGKVPLDVQALGIDLASISGHKMYGPKGIGAIYVNSGRHPRLRLKPFMSGGGQERGFRSGTIPSYLAIGLGEAAKICSEEMKTDSQWINFLSEKIQKALSEQLPSVVLNGHKTQRYKGNLNLSFDGVEGESLMMMLSDVCSLSSGSACTSASLEPSYVLRAIGVDEDLAHTSLRFGLGRFTTLEEVDKTIEAVKDAVNFLRDISPVWEIKQAGEKLSVVWS